jgi:signal transduction histidine kinase/HPt (histidine-containing phosphotransfer) domain-containing protein/AmiR/NasT family two-component response regulator
MMGVLATVFLLKMVLPPIRYGVSIAEAIAGGKLDNDINVKGTSEIFQLLSALSAMQASLAQNIRQLEAARHKAVQSEIAKGEFLANMSHELRTPLNNILGSSQLLHDRPMNEKDRDLFNIIERSSKTLLATVNDILDLSKLEAGEVTLEHIDFDIYDSLRGVSQTFLPRASKKGIILSCQTDIDSLRVIGDQMRVEGIVTNLLGNALRYTEKGSIQVRVRAMKDKPGRVLIRVEVKDSGIGIPKDKQGKIFERFGQADSSTTRRFGGTGLGLTITRQLVTLMQGKIGVDSEVGKGSTFWFEISFERSTAPVQQKADVQEAVEAGDGARPAGSVAILAAEDHELNRAFMRRLFENLGITNYVFAENGVQALEEIGKRDFNLVLMDCQMPEMDGFEATKAIRALPDARKKSVPIVAMTANAMASDKERCLKSGMDAYISKPFEISMFKRTLSPWVNFGQDNKGVEKMRDDYANPANLEILVAASMGDEAYLKEMVGLFVSTMNSEMEKLFDVVASKNDDHHTWIRAAHGLKGAASIVGADKMQQFCAKAQLMEAATQDEREASFKNIETERLRLMKFFQEKKLI